MRWAPYSCIIRSWYDNVFFMRYVYMKILKCYIYNHSRPFLSKSILSTYSKCEASPLLPSNLPHAYTYLLQSISLMNWYHSEKMSHLAKTALHIIQLCNSSNHPIIIHSLRFLPTNEWMYRMISGSETLKHQNKILKND